jgi:hypothetical protein
VTLARDGLPFRQAHALVESLVAEAQRTAQGLVETARASLASNARSVADRVGCSATMRRLPADTEFRIRQGADAASAHGVRLYRSAAEIAAPQWSPDGVRQHSPPSTCSLASSETLLTRSRSLRLVSLGRTAH